MTSTAVISDVHFGTNLSTLANPRRVDYLIWELWRYGDGCDEIVLLGDIFDLWRVRASKAVKEGEYFFKKLSELGVKVSYVVGNHDHHLLVMSQESCFLEKIARGSVRSVYRERLSWRRTINGLSLDMFYPVYSTRSGGRNIVFTHGHHLNGIQSFTIQMIEKLRRLSGGNLSPADLEMMMMYAYESIYRSVYIGEISEAENSLWKIPTIFDKVRSQICTTLRYTPVERQYEAIMEFIRDRRIRQIDYFVYGDTHKPDIYRRNGGPLSVNAGCWIDEGEKFANTEEISETYLIINEEGVSLRRLGAAEPLMSAP